ncbi:MAG: transcription-repair coupling factor [Simkaniaceae bacterium]|nr:transcription-repair coupling factor [Candidatus Sacchlamyda saccharinae]
MNLLLSPALSKLLQLEENSLVIEGLWDGPKSALISLLFEAKKKNILVITSDKTENRIASNLDYFGIRPFYEFPAWETLPGEEIPPSPDIVGRRFEILYNFLEHKEPKVILCPLQAVLQKLPTPKKLKPNCNLWKVGEEIPFDALSEFLEALGYKKEPVVADKGQFALRRGILDLFPLSAAEPFRVEFFGDTIESIRTFDPIGQKSIEKKESLFVCPASEPKLLEEEKDLATLFDYLGEDTIVIFDDLLALEDRYVALQGLPGSKSRFFATIGDVFEKTENLPHYFFAKEQIEELSDIEMEKKLGRDFYSGKTPVQPITFSVFDLEFSSKKWISPFLTIGDYFSPSENLSATTKEEILQGVSRYAKTPLELHFLTATQSEEETLRANIESDEIHLPEKTHFERGYLSSGFALPDAQIAILPMTELTGRFRVRRQKWRGTYHTPAAEFHELVPGNLVVHFHNGIGKYLGVEKQKNHLGKESEFLVIEYSGGSKLFVPISSSYLVSRYIGSHEEIPTLSQLGTSKWQNARVKAQQAIVGYAEQMLHQNAEREIQGGFVYPKDTDESINFETDFPFVETDDQMLAIGALKKDMMSEKAMDRLICGDVGYGKTEVCMRAAFKAVADGKKQVAVLVPTTVLAMQHYETFVSRMANYPINIGVVSRFLPAKKVRENIEKAANGQLDILIGTHRIISKDVTFKDLGLIIIDEEQRFGVRAKEHLKKLKTGVDCLTLSATPIPRTLYMSLIGARDVSVINTPPQDRLPIKSYIIERDPSVIQNAILRELSRDGQVFFLHNRVESIHKVAEELEKLVPQARVVVGHGQMSADELDRVYHLFKQGEADILVATTIIENGVDIPNANTILIDRSDTFGLADLYQCRGRVGRWNRPAYCYFLVPQRRELQEIATKRLNALVEASGYGGGMKIAMRDLEIRGAGDILGVKQSGQISSIGFHLYCKLLKRTIDSMRKKKSVSFIETKMEFSFDARLPEEYIGESSLRMEIYHRLGESMSDEEAEEILKEMQDRFGEPPLPVIWLYHLTRIRIFAAQKGYTLLKFGKYTLRADKQKGKEISSKNIPMPKESDPAAFEAAIKELL